MASDEMFHVIIDRRMDSKCDLGCFELAYRQSVPPTPAYMGLNLVLRGKQVFTKINHHPQNMHYQRTDRTLSCSNLLFRQRSSIISTISNAHKVMPTFNATEYIKKCITATDNIDENNTFRATKQAAHVKQIVDRPQQLIAGIHHQAVISFQSGLSFCPNYLRQIQLTNRNVIRSVSNFDKATRSQTSQLENVQNCKPNVRRYQSCGPRLNDPSDKTIKIVKEDIRKLNRINGKSAPQSNLRKVLNGNAILQKSKSDTNFMSSKFNSNFKNFSEFLKSASSIKTGLKKASNVENNSCDSYKHDIQSNNTILTSDRIHDSSKKLCKWRSSAKTLRSEVNITTVNNTIPKISIPKKIKPKRC